MGAIEVLKKENERLLVSLNTNNELLHGRFQLKPQEDRAEKRAENKELENAMEDITHAIEILEKYDGAKG